MAPFFGNSVNLQFNISHQHGKNSWNQTIFRKLRGGFPFPSFSRLWFHPNERWLKPCFFVVISGMKSYPVIFRDYKPWIQDPGTWTNQDLMIHVSSRRVLNVAGVQMLDLKSSLWRSLKRSPAPRYWKGLIDWIIQRSSAAIWWFDDPIDAVGMLKWEKLGQCVNLCLWRCVFVEIFEVFVEGGRLQQRKIVGKDLLVSFF